MMRRVIAWVSASVLLGTLLVAASIDSASAYRPWGSTSAKHQVMKPHCAYYPYRYVVDAPSDEWSAEVFLVGPRGGGIASAAFDSRADHDRARSSWRLCRPSIIAGRYKMKMKITWLRGYEKREGWVKPSYFRLRRR